MGYLFIPISITPQFSTPSTPFRQLGVLSSQMYTCCVIPGNQHIFSHSFATERGQLQCQRRAYGSLDEEKMCMVVVFPSLPPILPKPRGPGMPRICPSRGVALFAVSCLGFVPQQTPQALHCPCGINRMALFYRCPDDGRRNSRYE